MEGKKKRFFTFCKNKKIIEWFGFIIILGLFLYVPTGWIYDLWAGTGTEQGQWPNEDVQLVRGQEDLLPFHMAPVTVTASNLVRCPLMRLRDLDWEGEHYVGNHGKHYTIEEYNSTGIIPFSLPAESLLYNRYYLMELEDGSWICAYFDDYLVLTNSSRFPTGYLRSASREERQMLSQMARDYDVNTHWVIDMYRHGKMSLSIDILLRILFLCGIGCVVSLILHSWKKRKAIKLDNTAESDCTRQDGQHGL